MMKDATYVPRVEHVPISALHRADSPRLSGENADHIRLLAELDTELPPIVVHRDTMRVIDGMHRLAAARQRNSKTIAVQFFNGTDDDAFLAAIQLNIAHGLPLTLADRRSAATRILAVHEDWSDRRIAGMVGLSPKTVGTLRRGASEEFPHLTARIGRDGRLRRVTGNRTTVEDASEGTGSLSQAPHPRHQPGKCGTEESDGRRLTEEQYRGICFGLRSDPSLRMTDAGRRLIRLLELHLVHFRDWDDLPESVPAHRVAVIADLAAECARTWARFAGQVARRGLDSEDACREG